MKCANDSLARRKSVVRTGAAFASGAGGQLDQWGYNPRNELTGSLRYAGLDPNSPGTADPNVDRAYAYDPIGNRTVSRRGTDPNSLYQSNSLNQYLRIDLEGSELLGQRFRYDADGNLEEALAAGDADGDGDVDQDDVDLVLFYYDTPLPEPGDPNRPIYLRCDFSGNDYVDQDDIDILLYQFGEQYSSTLVAQFTWDGENRLAGWGPVTPKSGSKKLDFRYDFRNRRVEKKVSTYSGSAWAVSDVRRFVWSDWLMLGVLEHAPSPTTPA